MITRRDLLLAAMQPPSRRPNILLLLTDDQRFDTIGALGNREVRTPNMDRLVARGVTFTQAQTQGGLNGAICMPSRAQILTGRNMFEVHRDIVNRQQDPDPAARTFPEALRQAGYETFHTGKWHNGKPLFARSFERAGEVFFGGMVQQGEHRTEAFANDAIQYLARRDKSRPFLLSVAFTSPHDPRRAPERFHRMFPPERVTLPRNFLPQHPFDNGDLKVRDEMLASFPRTPEEIRRHLADYYAMIAEADHHVGRVLEALEASGEADNTFIVFAGDNGLAVGQHGLMGKQSLYEHSLRVPLVLCGPGVARGRRDQQLCYLMDIAPTLCARAGVALPSVTGGRDLLGNLPPRPAAWAAYLDVQRAVRTHDWKLIRYRVNGIETTQLFHLRADPWEMRNLAGQRNHAARERSLRGTLAQLLREAGATGFGTE